MKKLLVLLSGITLLSGCVSIPEVEHERHFKSSVKIKEYNSVAGKYYNHAVSGTAHIYDDGESYYFIKMIKEPYSDIAGYYAVSKKDTPKAIAMIEKFLKWNDIAVKDGDTINKSIGKYEPDQFYKIYTVSENENILMVKSCVGDDDTSIIFPCHALAYFDVESAKTLIMELREFLNDDLGKEIDHGKYL